MVRVVMFDLGLTLVDNNNHRFAHVAEALTAISSFKTADGKPLRSCLVSDFEMAPPPVTAPKVRAIFQQYLAVLDQNGLRPFFEPVDRRVTLSTQANAVKPDRAVFETALRRLRLKAALSDCVLITEDATHIEVARHQLGMNALRFDATGKGDFADWSQAPALIAHLVDGRRGSNAEAAIKMFLTAQGVEVWSLEPGVDADTFSAAGEVWRPIPVAGVDDPASIHVAVPVRGEVTLASNGEVRTSVPWPPAEHVAEAAAFAASLAAHGQIDNGGESRSAGATHEIAVDEKGEPKLVRRRFSAL